MTLVDSAAVHPSLRLNVTGGSEESVLILQKGSVYFIRGRCLLVLISGHFGGRQRARPLLCSPLFPFCLYVLPVLFRLQLCCVIAEYLSND